MERTPKESADEARLAVLIRNAITAFAPRCGVTLWTGERLGEASGPTILLRDPAALALALTRPSIGRLVELWMAGAIDIEGGTLFDLAAARPARKTREALKALDRRGFVTAAPALFRLARRAPRTSPLKGADAGRSGSTAEAIQYHYDVSNEFYALFLDAGMLYSCAYFDGWHDDIDKAQTDKLDMICRKLRLQPGERLLDIGCGWGSLLIHAVEHWGVSGHGVTLSREQYDKARARIAERGLSDRISIELKPFAEIEGRFDKISSIGMFEHVGFRHHDSYFEAVRKLLRPGGLYLHHAIARPAKKSLKAFHRGSREYRAIQRYIFPGGELDYIGHSLQKLEAHRFEIHDVENWREHYGRTCRIWAERLMARQAEAEALAGAPTTRLWILYLAGCALAFERGTVMIYQTLASRRAKGESVVPPTRRDLYERSHV